MRTTEELYEIYSKNFFKADGFTEEENHRLEGHVRAMLRPKFEEIFMELAVRLAHRSTCSRRSVGCVVTSTDFAEVYGIGYNGNEQGGNNHCDSTEPGNCGCLHAEDNALLKVNKGKHIPKVMFVTTVPCKTCAKRIINKGGFTKIYYADSYRCTKGKELLESRGIEVCQITEFTSQKKQK